MVGELLLMNESFSSNDEEDMDDLLFFCPTNFLSDLIALFLFFFFFGEDCLPGDRVLSVLLLG